MLRVLLSSSAYELSDYYPASEGLAAYNIMKQLNERVKFYAVAGNVLIKRPLKNARIYEIRVIRDYIRLSSSIIGLMNGFYYQLSAFLISSEILFSNKIDLVHRMFPAVYGLTSDPITSITKRMGIPFIIGPICHPTIGPSALRFTYGAHISTIKRASAVLVQTKRLKEAYLKMLDPDKVWVIPLGVDTDFFSPAENKVEREFIEILTVANLTKRKGIDYLIRAVHVLKKGCVRLRIVGDGPERARLCEIAKRLGLSDEVVFESRVSRRRLRDLYRSSDIFCLPSLVEPFGKVVIEAMACGKPVIVTNTEGPSQIVGHMRDGIIVPKQDHKKLAEAISLLFDRSLRDSMGRYARKKAEEYSWKRVAEKLYRIYVMCVENS